MWEFWDRPAHGVFGQTWLDRYRYLSSLWLGGGFKHVLFSPLPGEDFLFDLYFSNGLKPPPRWCHVSISQHCLSMQHCFLKPHHLVTVGKNRGSRITQNTSERPQTTNRRSFPRWTKPRWICRPMRFGLPGCYFWPEVIHHVTSVTRWWQLKYFWNFPPDPWGFMIQFDG